MQGLLYTETPVYDFYSYLNCFKHKDQLIYSGTSSCTAGIKNRKIAYIKAYPNPVADVLNVELPQPGVYNYRLYNATGELVEENTLSTSQFDVHELPQSLYFLVLTRNNNIYRLTFVKQ